jgi:hypothetical protein
MQDTWTPKNTHTRRLLLCTLGNSNTLIILTRSPYADEPEPEPKPVARDLLAATAEGLLYRLDEDEDEVVCNSDLRDAPLSGLGEFRSSTIPSSSSIRSSIRHILRPLLLPCWVDGPCCSSLMPALARVATFRTHPSKAPPMFSRPVDALDGTVDADSKEVAREFSGGCAGVRFGMCCARTGWPI